MLPQCFTLLYLYENNVRINMYTGTLHFFLLKMFVQNFISRLMNYKLEKKIGFIIIVDTSIILIQSMK